MQHSLMYRMLPWLKVLKRLPFVIACPQFDDFIIDYLEGELPKRQKIAFEVHLKICPECRNYLVAYQRTIEISKRALRSDQPPMRATMPDDLIKAIREARKA